MLDSTLMKQRHMSFPRQTPAHELVFADPVAQVRFQPHVVIGLAGFPASVVVFALGFSEDWVVEVAEFVAFGLDVVDGSAGFFVRVSGVEFPCCWAGG